MRCEQVHDHAIMQSDRMFVLSFETAELLQLACRGLTDAGASIQQQNVRNAYFCRRILF